MQRHRNWSRLAVRAAVVALLATVPLTAARPAQAHSCAGARSLSYTHYQGVARVSLTFYPECSDNQSHWHGTLYDTLCDKREARVSLVANWEGTFAQWEGGGSAGNGCGSSATFTGTRPSIVDYSPASWELRVILKACNFWGCSNNDFEYITA
jgi:hypothetical protein